MGLEIGILLAAMGITMLEVSEATAVGIAIYADLKKNEVFFFVALGLLAVLIPTAIAGHFISYLPIFYVRIFSATLLLYFGIRLIKSARRSFIFQKKQPQGGAPKHEELEKGLFVTAFSVGTVEAFEAAIVLVALFPNSYSSTILGLVLGIAVVIVAAFILHNQIRKVKQAIMKVTVSALLLAFSAFWYSESVIATSDLYLIPLFVIFFLLVYYIASRGTDSGKQATV